ncbi:Insulin-induced gene 1 protein [Cricetulus griseus]|uniref:Insulin-induced gene protein n=1 Tax=Cricetulus griseus TaxID=10029 RepID=G3ID14_CRIGR|nr:Insulin-induced gene 1 protein [Cricetulus griseus]ERE78863.1 insulin-induced protein [Cricetulus griseus]
MPRLHDHVWSCSSSSAARPYSLPRGMITAARCLQGSGAPEPASWNHHHLLIRLVGAPVLWHGSRLLSAYCTPCIDSHLGEPHKFKRKWASIMHCIAMFVGINHASAKLDFANNVQLSLTLAALSLGLWWTFDLSRSGLGLGITIAFLATLITQFLMYNGVYQYTSPDFLYIRSWLPYIFFSGGVTVGNIGPQLAMGVPEKPHSD